jgi:hypothetical protein
MLVLSNARSRPRDARSGQVTPLATGKPVGDGEADLDGVALAVVPDVDEVCPHPARRTTRRASPKRHAPLRTIANDKAKSSPVTGRSRRGNNSVEGRRPGTGGMKRYGYSGWRL